MGKNKNLYRAGLDQTDLAVWRLLRDGGGYWTSGDVIAELPESGSPHRVGGRLKRLFSGSHLVRIHQRREMLAYGVISTCVPPKGESLEPQPQQRMKESA